MQVIANNLANVIPLGLNEIVLISVLVLSNRKKCGFSDRDNTSLTSPLAVGTGVKVVSTQKLFTKADLLVPITHLISQLMDLASFKHCYGWPSWLYTLRHHVQKPDGLLTTPSGYVMRSDPNPERCNKH